MKKHITLLFLAFAIMQGCTQKSTVKKSSSSSNSGAITFPDSGSIGNTGTNGSTGGSTGGNGYNDIADCGQYTNNPDVDSTCYRTVSPTVKIHGEPLNGRTLFQTSLHAEIPQSYFESDLKFYVRIVPKPTSYNETTNGSLQTRYCSSPSSSGYSTYTYSKMSTTIEVRKKGSTSPGIIKTFYGDLKTSGLTPTAKQRFELSGPGEYDIIVRDIKTNHRCSNWGRSNQSCTVLEDLPFAKKTSATTPTDCVAFEIQFSTDYTRDLP